MSKIIEVKNLTYKVGRKKILNDLSFSVDTNSIVSVIGNGGSGKTTLLKLLAGILPSSNSIIFKYGYINTKKCFEDLKDIGCVFPLEFDFLFDSVYQELVFSLENLCYEAARIEKVVKDLVQYFNVSYLLDKKTSDLTQEESYIVHILTALIHSPKVLIMDDPFLMIKKSKKYDFIKKLYSYLKEHNITAIISSSNLEDVLFSGYVYVLNNGEIVMEGNTLEIFKEDDRLKKIGLQLPFMVDLSLKLIFYEILDDVHLDIEELVNKLWS